MKSALVTHPLLSNMNEPTQERSPIHASIVKCAIASRHTARNMNEPTQEKIHIYASIVKSIFVSHQTARNMKKYMQLSALSNESNMMTFRSQPQLLMARNLVYCPL